MTLLLGLTAMACSDEDGTSPEASDHVLEEFDAANFSRSTAIDNEWSPMVPGTQWVYEGFVLDEGESIPLRLEFTVTDLTKEINGVTTTVAWIADYEDRELVEAEVAFYAQDDDGNVWLFGEYPEEYDEGVIVETPTWIAGLKDSLPGIQMYANPQLETPSYFEGWGPAVGWTDYGKVDALGLQTCVVVACYEDVLVIAESSLGEPDAFQLKHYARGIGEVRVGWRGDDLSREELVLAEYRPALSAEALGAIRAQALELEDRAYANSIDVYGQTARASAR